MRILSYYLRRPLGFHFISQVRCSFRQELYAGGGMVVCAHDIMDLKQIIRYNDGATVIKVFTLDVLCVFDGVWILVVQCVKRTLARCEAVSGLGDTNTQPVTVEIRVKRSRPHDEQRSISVVDVPRYSAVRARGTVGRLPGYHRVSAGGRNVRRWHDHVTGVLMISWTPRNIPINYACSYS